ncbi:MAG TPA: hypothetical protein PLX65_13120, partial [Accumulibacter sp.]|nr:hypothetical protein [Accumulibacter sp.]
SMDVIWQRSDGLRRSLPVLSAEQWAELVIMSGEKVIVPIEALGTTLIALQSEMQQFVSQTVSSSTALVSETVTAAQHRLGQKNALEAHQPSPGEQLLGLMLQWYQLSGRLASVGERGLQPLLRQVKDNADRLEKRN